MFIRRILQSDYLTLWMCVTLVVVSLPITPGLGTSRNFANVLTVAMPLMLLAVGQMLVMLCGGIDLSVTSIAAVASVCGAWIMSEDKSLLGGTVLATPAAILAMPLVGACLGLVNGINVSRLGMPSFIATLSSMMFLYGFATWLTQSENIAALPTPFIALGTNLFLIVIVALVTSAFVAWGLSRTKYGRWVYAVGRNQNTAKVSGVPTQNTTAATYAVSGLLAGIASIIYTAQLETGSPVLAENQLLDVIGAVVIGGTSLFGGRGKVLWTAGGVLFISLLDNVLNLQNLSHFTVMTAKGAIILLAAIADSLRHQWSESA